MKAGLFSLLAVLGLAAGCTTPPKPMASNKAPVPTAYITGSRIPVPADQVTNVVPTVPQQVVVINPAMIARSGRADLAGLLRTFPGAR